MMAGVSGIYDEPELYQLACAYRDVPAESGALLTWLDKHAKIPDGVRSVIELAAGPAEHARELAHRGLRATALDHSAAMCGYAAAQAKAGGVDLDVVEADMRDFRITDADGGPARFDLAITMLNSVCHLLRSTIWSITWPRSPPTSPRAASTSSSSPTRPTSSQPSRGPAASGRSRPTACTRWSAGAVARTGSTRSPR